jgi:hypothetical protein
MAHPVFREFYKERDVVYEERRMNYESSPIGRLLLEFTNTAFTAHPYGFGGIGFPSDLKTFSRTQGEEYFRRHYVAKNMVVCVVGDVTLFRVHWDGNRLALDETFEPRYRTIDGQTYGWDVVIDADSAWFLDNGEGSERYAGTFRGQGISSSPLHLVRVDLATGAVALTEICGAANGVIANPPAIDPQRRIAVGYDSGNGVLAAFSFADGAMLVPLWTRQQDHACHPLRFPDTGELVTGDYDAERMMDQVVVLDIETGTELARADTGSPVQSVLFPAVGFDRDLYLCSFTTLTHVRVGRVGA